MGPIKCYHSRPEWTWEQRQWSGAPYSPKPQHHWNLTIRLFSVISRSLIGVCVCGGGLPLSRGAVGEFYSHVHCSYILTFLCICTELKDIKHSYLNCTPMKWNAAFSKQRSCRYCYIDALHGHWLNGWRKSLTATIQECCGQFWTSRGANTTQSSNCTATYLPSRKLSKLDEPDMQNTAGEAVMSS